MIIGIIGKAGSGKDTVAKILQYFTIPHEIRPPLNEYMAFFSVMYDRLPENLLPGEMTSDGNTYNLPNKLQNKKFAGKLKKICAFLLGINESDFEIEAFKNQLLPEEWQNEQGDMTYRKFLQVLGTDACRDNVHKNIWVNALFADYSPKEYWVITDVRFKNECDAVLKRNGILIYIEADKQQINAPSIKENHSSEQFAENFSKSDYNYIHIKNNFDGYHDLVEQLKTGLKNYVSENSIFDFN